MTATADASLTDALRAAGLGTLAGAFAYAGGEALSKPGLGSRVRTRVQLTDAGGAAREVYLKRYGREPLSRRLRRFASGRGLPSRGRAEFDAIAAVRAAGVPTMREIACGDECDWLGERRSYVIVSAVPGDGISRCGEELLARRPDAATELTERLAELVGGLHAAGLVHRDLYACHVFLHERDGRIELYLIDLARVFRPTGRRFRWFAKDLAALKYSMPPAWVERCWDAFLAAWIARVGRDGLVEGCHCRGVCGSASQGEAQVSTSGTAANTAAVAPFEIPPIAGIWNQAIDRRVAWMRRREK